MRIVLDTNCLLLIISKKGSYYSIYNAIQKGIIQLVITNEIIYEYEEILEKLFSHEFADYFIKAILNHTKTIYVEKIFFNWNLISVDEDDNKFIDAYIIGNSEYLVTNDKHFDVLKSIPFPNVNIINLIEFQKMLISEIRKQ